MDWLLGLAGVIFGGGVSWLVFFRASKKKAEGEALQVGADAFKSIQDLYQQALADGKAEREELKVYIEELKSDRRLLREERDELRDRIDKTEAMVRALQQAVARNGRMVEAMRPFLCGRIECKERTQVMGTLGTDENNEH